MKLCKPFDNTGFPYFLHELLDAVSVTREVDKDASHTVSLVSMIGMNSAKNFVVAPSPSGNFRELNLFLLYQYRKYPVTL